MKTKIKVDGIYDLESLATLKECEITDLGFDFRPKSFNFLQQHVFQNLLEQDFSLKNRYFLHYAGEANFIILKMLDDLREQLDTPLSENFVLEFSDLQTVEFYEQFKLPYICHYNDELPLAKLLKARNFQGLVLSYSYLHELYQHDRLSLFFEEFIQTLISKGREDLQLHLSLDWGDSVMPSLLECVKFSKISFSINELVENSYRSVDLGRMKMALHHHNNFTLSA